MNNGATIFKKNIQQTKLVQESLNSIKEVLLYANQNIYLDRYQNIDYPIHKLKGDNNVLSIFPKYIFETLSLIFIISIGIIFSDIQGENSIISTLGVFAFATSRLLPSIQLIYSSWANIKAYKDNFQRINELSKSNLASNYLMKKVKNFSFKKSFILKDIDFKFDQKQILNKVNLEIRPGDKVGIIGETGSGKSTLVNIILGLLKPLNGEIIIDGSKLESTRAWQNLIAYVPQNVTLHDISLIENIAFGIDRNEINIDRVKKAIKLAMLEDFIKSNEDNLNIRVGEKGEEISGGEVQRIGIARAFYRNPKVLILDESTSALDIATEKQVLNSVLIHSKTLIMVSHKLNTIKQCNRIFYLNKSKLIEIAFKDAEILLLKKNR